MNLWSIVILTLCIAAAQATSRSRTGGRTSVGGRLGDSCEYDDDCDVAYSFCRAQQTCECKRGFESAPTRDRCVATIGAICSSSYDCTGLPNAECSQEVCSCRGGFVAHPTMKECLQVAAMYEATCTEHGQCTTAFGDRIECRDNKCQCITKHHYVDGMCIQSKGLDELCTNHKECHVSHTDVSKNEQVTCTSGRCQCIIGFRTASDMLTCTDGAAQMSTISLLGILIIYAIARIIN